ncbi:MAG TPA: VCBS repeat-containing protein [bacterium]|nr:VCBS repeat-containing protein [bacterium]
MRNAIKKLILTLFVGILLLSASDYSPAQEMIPVRFNNPGLTVDLGVGLWAWPLPLDYDADGDMDLLVSCNDKPYNGTYFFENRQGNVAMPVFEPGVRIGEGFSNIQISYMDDGYRILRENMEFVDIIKNGMGKTVEIDLSYGRMQQLYGYNTRYRAKQWKFADINSDGLQDIYVGLGDWSEYGWDNAYDDKGNWTNGPLHGRVYVMLNKGSVKKAKYGKPFALKAEGGPVDVYGMPSPNFADFDGDGDLDLICGEFLDRFTWFENRGSATSPSFAQGRYLKYNDETIKMDLEMIVTVSVDWDGDGDVDLIVGQEDGRVAFVENTGRVSDSMPVFKPPVFFRQRADLLKFGALATPYSFDWDNDGDEDLICGNTAGYIGYIENLGGGESPVWAEPVYLSAGGKVIRIQAGENGSIQGPAEAKWGYTVLTVADWDIDGLQDIIINSIIGEIKWFRNVGTREKPVLEKAENISVEWDGEMPKPEWNWWNPRDKQLVTQWRTTPFVMDYNKDGLPDLVMMDHDGYLAYFERAAIDGRLVLMPGKRIFEDENGEYLRLNVGKAGKSGRRKIYLVDWDFDGNPDIVANSRNVDFYRNAGTVDGRTSFKNMGEMSDRLLAGHSSCPAVVDWNRDGIPDLLVGAEDGHFYYMKNTNKPD